MRPGLLFGPPLRRGAPMRMSTKPLVPNVRICRPVRASISRIPLLEARKVHELDGRVRDQARGSQARDSSLEGGGQYVYDEDGELRAVLGLVKKRSGTIELFGVDLGVVTLDVGLRYFAGRPFAWSHDFVSLYLTVSLFYLALVALIIGVQLFVTGFLAEMFAMQSLSKRDYLVIDKVGFEEDTAARRVPSLAS